MITDIGVGLCIVCIKIVKRCSNSLFPTFYLIVLSYKNAIICIVSIKIVECCSNSLFPTFSLIVLSYKNAII